MVRVRRPVWIDSQPVMGDDAGIEASQEDPTTDEMA